jgi:energy-coupling factor transporter ATP-binding protein EcfA2
MTFKYRNLIFQIIFFSSLVGSLALYSVASVNYEDRLLQMAQETKTPEQNIKELRPSKHQIIDALFASTGLPAKLATIIMPNEWQELEMDDLIKKLDRSKTSFGFWGLKQLTQPVSNREAVFAMQNKVRTLVADKAKHAQLRQLLENINASENDLLSYWDDTEDLQIAAKGLYYSILPPYTDSFDNVLNHNRLVLEGTIAYQAGRRALAFGTNLCALGLAAETFNTLVYKTEFNMLRALENGLKRPFTFNNPFPTVYKDGYDEKSNEKFAEFLSSGSAGDLFKVYKHKMPTALAFSFVLLTVGHYNVQTALDFRDDWRNLVYLTRTTNLLRNRMVRISTLFKSINALHAFMQQNVGLFDANIIRALDLGKLGSNIKDLVELLGTKTFESSQSHVYSRGRVLLANQLMRDYKNELIPALQGIAIVDGYYSIASLYVEHADLNSHFCFTEFSDQAEPQIIYENFWTPLMPADQAVLNSIDWGQDKKNKIILTGPNGSGKSTIMKAMAHAIILAQSWGIVPASKASMTLFTGLRTSLAPKESLQNNLSTFMAEKLRMDSIRSFIRQSSENDRYFVLLDEPYRGTIASEAEQRICVFGKDISSFDHCMLMMATHLEKPITLEDETGVFANYQLGLDEKDAHFIRTFKLLKGPALWWFHDIDRRMRFIDQLLVTQSPTMSTTGHAA